MSESVSGLFSVLFGKTTLVPQDAFPVHRPCTYLIRSADGFAKIGTADNTIERLAQLQTGNPHQLELVATARGGRETEIALHKRHDDLRRRGEWFTWDDSLLDGFLPGVPCHHVPAKPVCIGGGATTRESGRLDRQIRKAETLFGRCLGSVSTKDAFGAPVQIFDFERGWSRAEQVRTANIVDRIISWRFDWWISNGVGFRDGDEYYLPVRDSYDEEKVTGEDLNMIHGRQSLSAADIVRFDKQKAIELIAQKLAPTVPEEAS